MKKKITPRYVLKNLDEIVTATTLGLCVILVNVNIVLRYFFGMPLRWCEEVVTSLFVWTVFIGSAFAYRRHEHLGVDILVKHLPEKVRKTVGVVMSVLELLILVMLTVISSQYVYNIMFSRSGAWRPALTDLLRIPKWWTSISVPIGFGLSTLHSIRFMINRIRGIDADHDNDGEEGGSSDGVNVY